MKKIAFGLYADRGRFFLCLYIFPCGIDFFVLRFYNTLNAI